MPPTTPPAIAPLFELPLVGEFDGDDDTDEVVLEVGTTEGVPVTPGASVMMPKYVNCGVDWQSSPSPTSCATITFQLSSDCGGNEIGLSRERKQGGDCNWV